MENKMDEDRRIRNILSICYKKAAESPDTSTQLGAVLMNNRNYVEFTTLSYNGFVKGWTPTEADYERPQKYLVGEHAERRVIYKAANSGISTYGGTLFCTWAACVDCARAIVESGIERLVRHYPPLDDATERWLESTSFGDRIMKAGGVKIVDVIGPIPEAVQILRGGEIFDPRI